MVYKRKIKKTYLLTPLALLISGVLSPTVFADDTSLEVIEVYGHVQNKHLALGSSESLLSDLGVIFQRQVGCQIYPF
jgi:iron complex outermembrane receptor protein